MVRDTFPNYYDFSSVTFKIAIFALLIYAIVQYFQAKEETKIIEPTLVKEKQTISGEVLIKKQAFKNFILEIKRHQFLFMSGMILIFKQGSGIVKLI